MATFNFDISKTLVFKSFKTWSFPLFKYAKVFVYFFLFLFIISLFLVGSSFLGATSKVSAAKVSLFSLVCLLAFWEVYLFIELKIKRPRVSVSIAEALADPNTYNLAEFLTLSVCGIIESTILKSKNKKMLGVSSQSLLYFTLRKSADCKVLLSRLGLDFKKLQQELKNHLEKQHRDQQFNVSLSESFQETIKEAATVASNRGQTRIGEKELLVALAFEDEFFKKVLQEHDLHPQDVESLTLWMGAFEQKIREQKKFWSKENLAKFGSLGRDFASGFTVTLDAFSVDWRAEARKNIFNEIVGHQKETSELELVLAKSNYSNALLVGEKGAGRKSVIESLAQRCYSGTGLPELKGKRVVELNMVSLVSQIQSQEKLETTLDQIFKEVLAASNVVLVIDELDNFVGGAVSKPGASDISAILGKYLSLPQFHFVGITSFEGLHHSLEQNAAFLEYFAKVEVLEISELETTLILQNLALSLEKKYRLLITYPAIRETINLTGRYFPSVPFPKKAIDVLQEAAVYLSTLKDLSLGRHMHFKLMLPQHIAKIVSEKTNIPVGKMEFKEKTVLLNLENLIHQRIVGQEEAVRQIAIALRRARSGIGSKTRPMGSFLFLGPTGVGKTETAKALAQIYFGGQGVANANGSTPQEGAEKMVRIDMSEFQEISDIGRLIGQTSPVAEQGLLTTPVRDNPFSLVLLDEIEKAHPDILNLFLQILDEGYVTDGQGRKVIFTNTIIIATSNAGAEVIFQQIERGSKVDKDKLFGFLFEQGIFKPELVNRFDAAVFFHPLTKENLMDIAQLNLASLQKKLKDKDIDLTVTQSLKEKIVELSYKPEFGARQMRRVMQDNIENVIAQALLSDTIVKGDRIEINPENFQIIKNPVVEK